jgi:FtsZ-interacting cell division protein ZipA
MGQLQQALLVVGALIIAAVVALNLWQSWQLRQRRPRSEASSHAAGQNAGAHDNPQREQQEPGLDDQPERIEPELTPAEISRPRTSVPRIDPIIDAIVSFLFDLPIPGEALQQRLPRTARAGSKPMLFEGRNAQTGQWEALQPEARYIELQAAVQLASRSGALNAIEYSEFVTKCHALGEALGAAPDLPDMSEVLEQARDLDNFAAANDAQLSINLQAQGVAWGVDYLRQQANAAGFTTALAAGRLALTDMTPSSVDADAGTEPGRSVALVQLQFDAQADLADNPEMPVNRATLLLDVPQVPQALQPFARMREAARRLGQSLDARQVDDNGAPLSHSALDQIEHQLQQLYSALDARSLPAGTATTQRLFS